MDRRPLVISFRGPIGCGKTTAADHLVNRWNFKRVSFAQPLKLEVFNHLWEKGGTGTVNDDVWIQYRKDTKDFNLFPVPDTAPEFILRDLYYISDEEKSAWINANKAALRPLLQWWGTEYRRGQSLTYWTDQAYQKIQRTLATGHAVVIDDARFDNEFEILAGFGCKQIFLLTPNAEQLAVERSGGGAVGIKGHASEQLLDPCDPRNFTTIGNFGDVKRLHTLLNGLVLALHEEKS